MLESPGATTGLSRDTALLKLGGHASVIATTNVRGFRQQRLVLLMFHGHRGPATHLLCTIFLLDPGGDAESRTGDHACS